MIVLLLSLTDTAVLWSDAHQIYFFAPTRSPQQSSQREGEGERAGGAKEAGGERTRRTQVFREGARKRREEEETQRIKSRQVCVCVRLEGDSNRLLVFCDYHQFLLRA